MDTVLKTWGLPLLCLAVISTAFFLYFGEQKSVPQAPAQLAPASQQTTLLALSPQNLKLQVGETARLAVDIDTSSDTVSAVTINLTYNPKVAAVESVSADKFFDNPVVLEKNIDNKKGLLTLSLGTLVPKKGKGTVAVIKVKGIKKGLSDLNLEKSQVAATGKNTTVVKSTSGGKITVE